jgi:acyl-CoA reductase-like NAD-dependent aldehyde dehydrogenase
VTVAEDASEPWAATVPRERAEVLRRASETMTVEADHIAGLIQLANGTSLAEARRGSAKALAVGERLDAVMVSINRGSSPGEHCPTITPNFEPRRVQEKPRCP